VERKENRNTILITLNVGMNEILNKYIVLFECGGAESTQGVVTSGRITVVIGAKHDLVRRQLVDSVQVPNAPLHRRYFVA